MRRIVLASAAAATGLAIAAGLALAGPEKMKFPVAYKTEFVVYNVIDRPDRKAIRFAWINKSAHEAAMPGQPLPHGTYLLIEEKKARLDGQGNLVRDAEGRLVPTDEITTFIAMEKQPGWGAEYPADKRNGEWEYAVYGPTGAVPGAAVNTTPCFICHLSRDSRDYVFTYYKNRLDAGK